MNPIRSVFLRRDRVLAQRRRERGSYYIQKAGRGGPHRAVLWIGHAFAALRAGRPARRASPIKRFPLRLVQKRVLAQRRRERGDLKTKWGSRTEARSHGGTLKSRLSCKSAHHFIGHYPDCHVSFGTKTELMNTGIRYEMSASLKFYGSNRVGRF